MKRNILIMLVVAVATLTTVSALAAQEKVNLKGTVLVSNRLHPELKSDNKNFVLLLRGYRLTDVKDNDKIEVEGFKMTKELMDTLGIGGHRNLTLTSDNAIVVSKVTIGSKTIDIVKERENYRNKMSSENGQKRGKGMRMKGNRGFGYNR